MEHFYLWCCIVGRLFVACPPSPDICLYVCFTLDCVQFSKTDCASVRFNVDNGNKTSPWFAHIRLAYPLPKFRIAAVIFADCLNRGRRSLTKMDRLGNVQSSVWTLQQILPSVDTPIEPIALGVGPFFLFCSKITPEIFLWKGTCLWKNKKESCRNIGICGSTEGFRTLYLDWYSKLVIYFFARTHNQCFFLLEKHSVSEKPVDFNAAQICSLS